MSKSTNIDVKIKFMPDILEKLTKDNDNNTNALEKTLKLVSSYSTTNMHLFDGNEKLVKYESVIDIIKDYCIVRLDGYKNRKTHVIKIIQNELLLLNNKKRYIEETLQGVLDFRNKKKDDIIKLLNEKKYDLMDQDEEYKYLTKMPMDSVSTESVEKLMKDHHKKSKDLDYYMNTTEIELWLNELQELKNEYLKYAVHRDKLNNQ
jgi:DNA topoisomerase-2